MTDSLNNAEYSVLDKGFVKIVDYMGNDNAIVQAARVSYGAGTKTPSTDRALIRYLMKHMHTSPFEMCEIKLHIKAPIFVARQWLRHRTANVNEYSARYSILESEYYIPQQSQLTKQSTNNKQGKSNEIVDNVEYITDLIDDISQQTQNAYQNMLDVDLARELARIVLPVNYYTQFYWKIDLHNLLHFLKLRLTENAQYEIRQYAQVIFNILKIWLPITHEAFIDYRLNSHTLSKTQIDYITKLIHQEDTAQEHKKLSKREIAELEKLFHLS